uniref:Sjogrens syndrome scleroderma autoantigen 1 n=1 Tax=Ignisphaera aggregans TaxID=334771 RepID=A0A7C4BE67_9CREN
MRSGATMLAESCPLCGSPLFKLTSGEVVCPIHGRVMLVKTEEELSEANVASVLLELEKSIADKLSEYVGKLRSDKEVEFEDIRNIISWLDALERVERIKTTLTKEREQEKPKEKSSKKT